MNFLSKGKKKNNKGFTLVELLVVIAIIGILAAVIAPNIFAQIEKGKTSSVVSEYRAAKTAALLMITDNPTYVLTNTISDPSVTSFHANLEKNIINQPNPFSGTYTVSENTGDEGKFLIISNVPRRAGDSIAKTLIGQDAAGFTGAGNNPTADVRWVSSAASAAVASQPANATSVGFLAIRLLP